METPACLWMDQLIDDMRAVVRAQLDLPSKVMLAQTCRAELAVTRVRSVAPKHAACVAALVRDAELTNGQSGPLLHAVMTDEANALYKDNHLVWACLVARRGDLLAHLYSPLSATNPEIQAAHFPAWAGAEICLPQGYGALTCPMRRNPFHVLVWTAFEYSAWPVFDFLHRHAGMALDYALLEVLVTRDFLDFGGYAKVAARLRLLRPRLAYGLGMYTSLGTGSNVTDNRLDWVFSAGTLGRKRGVSLYLQYLDGVVMPRADADALRFEACKWLLCEGRIHEAHTEMLRRHESPSLWQHIQSSEEWRARLLHGLARTERMDLEATLDLLVKREHGGILLAAPFGHDLLFGVLFHPKLTAAEAMFWARDMTTRWQGPQGDRILTPERLREVCEGLPMAMWSWDPVYAARITARLDWLLDMGWTVQTLADDDAAFAFVHTVDRVTPIRANPELWAWMQQHMGSALVRAVAQRRAIAPDRM